MRWLPLFAIAVISLFAMALSCGHRSDASSDESLPTIPDTLRVGTLYSPTSYFIYKGEEMGYEYDLMRKVLSDHNVAMEVVVAHSIDSMIVMLNDGRIDVIAYEIPITSEYKSRVLHCGRENITHQVLVQPRGDSLITDVTQLVGRDVYVEQNSKYEYRLQNLNNELGGGINIHSMPQDSLITEDLIGLISEGKLPLTIVDSDIARLNKTYYDDIDISLAVSFPQRASWAVRTDNNLLADSINAWVSTREDETTAKSLLKRYFEISKNRRAPGFGQAFDHKHHRISQYDHLFKRYAAQIDWDWRLLAAQGYAESQFDTAVVSWAGARGIMQIMPATAKAYGLSLDSITDPERNIATSVLVIRGLNRQLSKLVPDKQERLKFIIAAYNSGIGHVYDAIALARKYGKNPEVWESNVEEAILMKANPEYFNDDVCRFGYFKGKQTVNYVVEVQKIYELYQHKIPK